MSAVLLDTCALLAHAVGTPMRGGAARAIRLAESTSSILVPSVAATEIAQKVAAGKLSLDGPSANVPRLWFARAMGLPGVVEVAVKIDHALAAYELPEPFHKDPADRLVVAMARLIGVPVITSDGRILDYAALGHVRAIAC